MSDNLNILGVIEPFDGAWRKRMRQKAELVAFQFAPTARVTISKFQEIDGSIKFRVAYGGLHLLQRGINLYKRTGSQHGIKSEIPKPDEAILLGPKFQMLQDGYGNFSPFIYEAGEQVRSVETVTGLQMRWKGHGLVRICVIQIDKTGLFGGVLCLVFANTIEIDAEHRRKCRKSYPVNTAEAGELVKARGGIGILKQSEPSVRDAEFPIALNVGN